MQDYYDKEEIRPKDMEYVIVKSADYHVFAGFLSEHSNGKVCLEDARELIRFDCRSLSGLAYEGPLDSDDTTKMTPVVEKVYITFPSLILTCTKEATDKILNFPNSDFRLVFKTRVKPPEEYDV